MLASSGTTTISACAGVNRELLHRAGHRRSESRNTLALRSLGTFALQLGSLEVGLCKPVVQVPSCLGQVGGLGMLAFGEGGVRFADARALRGQVALELDALARAVLPGVAGNEPLRGQTLDVGFALARQRQRVLELGACRLQRRGFGLALGDLGIQPSDARTDVGPFGFDQCAGLCRRVLLDARRAVAVERGEQRAGALALGLRSGELLPDALAVGTGGGGIELDEHLAGLHPIAVADLDRAHDSRLQRLDNLGAFAHDNAPRRHRDDVDAPDDGPRERDHEQRADRDRRTARCRVRWRDLERQGGRQEGALVGKPLRAGELSTH
jgi:hypothetical protein